MQQTIETKAIAPSVYAVHGNHHDRERYLWELEVTRRGGRATTQLPFAKLPTKTVLDVRGSEENKKDVRLHRLEFFLPADTPVFTAPAPKRKVDSQNRPITCSVYWVEGGLTVKKEVTEIWIHVPGRKPVVVTGSDLPRSIKLVIDVTVSAVDLIDALTGEPLKKKGIETKVVPLFRRPTAVAVFVGLALFAKVFIDGVARAHGF